MFGRKRQHKEHVARVAERLRMLDNLTPLAQANAGAVKTRIMNLNYGRKG